MVNECVALPATDVAQVLVVDDDPAIRQVISWGLGDEGYTVATAANGREALEYLAAHQPHLILLDLQMPIMSGWELQAQLREQGVRVPVVFMTAGYRARAEAEQHQAAGYLGKPFDVSALLDTVERFVPGARS
jgi:CheY-like chemotaxis protein